MKTALVTGASRGIGLETALALARHGYRVAAAMRTPARAPELAATAALESLPIEVLAMDVDADQSVLLGVERVVERLGPIDVLVCNAGIERTGAVEELPLSEFRAVMETNYFGPIRAIQAVLPSMRERRSGCIINVTSISGRLSASPLAPYAASKFALEALSECLAQEVKAFGVRVGIIEPGIIDTAMARSIGVPSRGSSYPQQRRNAALFEASLKNPVPPSLVAKTIVDFASSESWQLRHLVGPDAGPFLGWRQSMTDEEWVTFGSLSDEDWTARVKRDFGMDVRL
jgi:NAD(P)-dependent dehydrogenase (short-subunit alcohol dehydrogenase family)